MSVPSIEPKGKPAAKPKAISTPKAVKAALMRKAPVDATRSLLAASPEERYRHVSQAAYFRALRRGFTEGQEMDDWLEAEAEVDALLSKPPAD